MVELNATINRSIMLKTYNQSNIDQLGRCSIRIRNNDKHVKCRFFVVSGNAPALFGMWGIDLHGIIKVL